MGFIGVILYYVLTAYNLILLARVLMTWLPNVDRYHPVVKFIYDVTEPVLKPIRQVLPQGMGIDFSPMIVILIIGVLMQVVI
ncbi:MAG: YggT family protein [Pleurocapsa minor GSE-CHR-MK-17-07R]|jgi:YggT family protein|nr:YggT family protein [Pleurocapsa minor GSE-CHR-MK 17-07R]